MKRLLVLGALIGALSLAGLAASASSTNFAGTWVLDKGRSESLPRQLERVQSYTMLITQDGERLTVENKIESAPRADSAPDSSRGDRQGRRGGREGRGGRFGQPKATYTLDGKEQSVETPRGIFSIKALWKGDALELTETRNINREGNEMTVTTTDYWELAEGGKVLNVNRTINSPRGTQQSKLTFNRQ